MLRKKCYCWHIIFGERENLSKTLHINLKKWFGEIKKCKLTRIIFFTMHCYIFISLLSCICNILKRSKYFLYKMIIFYRYLLFNTIKKTVSIGKYQFCFYSNDLNFQVIYLFNKR